jgi:hypothetical protein
MTRILSNATAMAGLGPSENQAGQEEGQEAETMEVVSYPLLTALMWILILITLAGQWDCIVTRQCYEISYSLKLEIIWIFIIIIL